MVLGANADVTKRFLLSEIVEPVAAFKVLSETSCTLRLNSRINIVGRAYDRTAHSIISCFRRGSADHFSTLNLQVHADRRTESSFACSCYQNR